MVTFHIWLINIIEQHLWWVHSWIDISCKKKKVQKTQYKSVQIMTPLKYKNGANHHHIILLLKVFCFNKKSYFHEKKRAPALYYISYLLAWRDDSCQFIFDVIEWIYDSSIIYALLHTIEGRPDKGIRLVLFCDIQHDIFSMESSIPSCLFMRRNHSSQSKVLQKCRFAFKCFSILLCNLNII